MIPELNDEEIAALAAAEELNDEAIDAASSKAIIDIAHRALRTSPLSADSYVNLALHGARGDAEELFYWRAGVLAGELAIGTSAFAELAGEFWLHMETRPYMRARHGLAMALWSAGQRQEAVEHLQQMLELNPNDNQGIRYILVGQLIELGRDKEAAALLTRYREDDSAHMTWPAVLLAFRKSGDGKESAEALLRALESNPHVTAYLTGAKRTPKSLPDYYSPGDRSEAVIYVAEQRHIWAGTEGAIEWLRAASTRLG